MANESKPLPFDDEESGRSLPPAPPGIGLWPIALPNELMLQLNAISQRVGKPVVTLIAEGLEYILQTYKKE